MLELSTQQRALLAETFREMANIAAAAMVFGQFLAGRPFSPWLALVGVACWGCLVACALALAERN